jgi:hypothetical protein
MLDALSRLPDAVGERITALVEAVDDVLDEAWKRVVAVGTAIAALISALLAGNMSLVPTIVALPGQAWAAITATPGIIWAWLASIPGIVWTWLTGAAGAGVAAGTGLLESWGLSFLATVIAIVAEQPWIAGVLVFGIVAAAVGPDEFRNDFKLIIQLLLLSVLGYVGALTLGEGLLENLPLVVLP